MGYFPPWLQLRLLSFHPKALQDGSSSDRSLLAFGIWPSPRPGLGLSRNSHWRTVPKCRFLVPWVALHSICLEGQCGWGVPACFEYVLLHWLGKATWIPPGAGYYHLQLPVSAHEIRQAQGKHNCLCPQLGSLAARLRATFQQEQWIQFCHFWLKGSGLSGFFPFPKKPHERMWWPGLGQTPEAKEVQKVRSGQGIWMS